jgi:hypothetical protein
MCADETLDWKTPQSVRRGTQTDISQLLQFQFWEPIVYLDTEEQYPATKEKPGRWLGIAHNVGDFFCWKIYDEEKEIILERSVINSRRTKPHLHVEQELKELYGIEGSDDDASSESDMSITSTKQKVETDHVKRDRLRERRKRRKKKPIPSPCPSAAACQQDKDVDQALRNVIGAAATDNETPAEKERIGVNDENNGTPTEPVLTQPNVTTPMKGDQERHGDTPMNEDEDDVLTRTPPTV